MKQNYYIERVKEIAKLGNEREVDWTVAVSMYDAEHGMPYEDKEAIAADRAEFYEFVRGKRFDENGEEVK